MDAGTGLAADAIDDAGDRQECLLDDRALTGTLPTTWTVVPSGEMRPACGGGATNGSTTSSNVGRSAPSTVARAAVRSATRSRTAAGTPDRWPRRNRHR